MMKKDENFNSIGAFSIKNVEDFNCLDYDSEDWKHKPLKREQLNKTLRGSVILAAEVIDYPASPAI